MSIMQFCVREYTQSIHEDSHYPQIQGISNNWIKKEKMSELQLIEIVERLWEENRELKNRVDVLEAILSNWLPIVEEKK